MLGAEQKVEKKYPLKEILKMIKFKSLNQSKQFQEILKKKKISSKYFSIYFDRNLSNSKKNNKILNISFVTKKKLGNAVARNKITRKLNAAVLKLIREKRPIDLNYTYVILGRNNVYKDKFQLIFSEVNNIFERISKMSN